MCKLSFTIPILGGTSFSENLMLFSKVKLTLNCFQKWFSGFYKNVELEDAKSFSLRTQHVQKISFCVME